MPKEETRTEPDAQFLITVKCDGLHPDDIEELQRSLETSRYRFKVEVHSKVRTENYPELFVIGINTTLLVRFSPSWMRGHTRRGGVKTIVKIVDEIINNSSHDRNRKPRVGVGPNGEPVVTTEEASRGRKKQTWNRGDVLVAAGLIVAVLTLIAAFVIPEVRRVVGLEKPNPVSAPVATSEPKVTVQPPVGPLVQTPTQEQQRPHRTSEPSAQSKVALQPNSKDDGSIGSSISQGAGSIAQIGGSGNTATVINNGPRPLVLSQQQQSGLASRLSGFQGESIEIDVNSATPQTSTFADALVSSLHMAGITAHRNDGMFVGGCASYPGVSFMAGINRMKLVQAIWSGLVEVGAVDPSPSIPGCSRSGEPDELHIRIFAP